MSVIREFFTQVDEMDADLRSTVAAMAALAGLRVEPERISVLARSSRTMLAISRLLEGAHAAVLPARVRRGVEVRPLHGASPTGDAAAAIGAESCRRPSWSRMSLDRIDATEPGPPRIRVHVRGAGTD